ncbi:MAG: hypothetical protein HQM08_27220 [Candidatus Riflebacteria bacterium]|nr:hypothetical protein [Candidatus Riflebacteria bacterium]
MKLRFTVFDYALGLFFCLFVIIIPCILFSNLLQNLQNNLRQNIISIQYKKAVELLVEFENSMEIPQILKIKFRKFINSAMNAYLKDRINSDSIKKLPVLFKKITRKKSLLLFFDSKDKLVIPRGYSPPKEGKRPWEALISFTIGNKALSSSEFHLAEQTSKSLMGDLITLEILKKKLRNGEVIFFKKSKILFTINSCGSRKKASGICSLPHIA